MIRPSVTPDPAALVETVRDSLIWIQGSLKPGALKQSRDGLHALDALASLVRQKQVTIEQRELGYQAQSLRAVQAEARVEVLEEERDEWKEKWKRCHERLGVALGMDTAGEDVDALASSVLAGLRRGRMKAENAAALSDTEGEAG